MKKRSIMQVVMFLILVLCIPSVKVRAASCNIKLGLDKDKIVVGDEFILTIAVEAEENINGVEFELSYDDNALEFITGSPAVSGGDGTLKISQLDIPDGSKTAKYVVKLKASLAMTTNVKVEPNAAVYNEGSTQGMAVASSTLEVAVDAQETASKDAKLKTLKLSNGKLKPEFSSDVTEYNVSIEEEVSRLIISAIPQDSKATVKVQGGDQLVPGQNEITIIVTAESGDTLKYNVHVDYQEPTPILTPIEEPEKAPEPETSEETKEEMDPPAIAISSENSKIVLTTYGSFAVEDASNVEIPAGYEATTVIIQGVSVQAYENRNEISDFVLIYASKEGTQPRWYQYDKVERTIQRFHVTNAVEESKTQQKGEQKASASLLIVFILLSLLFMVTTLILLIRMWINRHES